VLNKSKTSSSSEETASRERRTADRGLSQLLKTLRFQGFLVLKNKSNEELMVMSRKIPDKRMDHLILDLKTPILTMTTIISKSERLATFTKEKKFFGGEKSRRNDQDVETNIQYVAVAEDKTYEGLWARAEKILKIKVGKEKGVILPPSRVEEAIKSLASRLYYDVPDLSTMETAATNDPEACLEFLIRVGGEERANVAERILEMLNIKVGRDSSGKLTIERALDIARKNGIKESKILSAATKLMKENPRCNRKAA